MVTVIGVFIIVLVLSLYLIFAPKTRTEKVTLANTGVAAGWDKILNYTRNYDEMLKSKEINLMFEGNVLEVDQNKLIIGQGNKTLSYDLANLKYDKSRTRKLTAVKDKTATLTSVDFSTIVKGDRVNINITVEFFGGTEKVDSIILLPK